MLLTSLVTAAEEGNGASSVFSPIVVGALCLGVLLVLMAVLLAFGRGREHS